MFPLAAFKNSVGRAVPQVREAAGILSREGERIEIAFEAHKAQRTKAVCIFFCISSFKTTNGRHRIGGRAESNVPDHQFVGLGLSLQ